MAHAEISGKVINDSVLEFLTQERTKALSVREWKFRLVGYGYAVNEVRGEHVVSTLPQGVELGILPAHMI